jgi:hypothetical protein
MRGTVKSVLLVLLVFLAAGTWAVQAAAPVSIAYVSGSARSKIGALIMVEVYKRANITATVMPLPGIITSEATETSAVAGESAHVYDYTEAHPTLTRVEPAVTEWTTVAFFKGTDKVKLMAVEDLKNYRVGYVNGTRAADDLIAKLQLSNVEGVDTPEALFNMLADDRIDIALDGGTDGAYWIHKKGYQQITQFEINRVLLYHVLSPKYRGWAPVLGKVITDMSKSGELAKLAAQAEKEVMEKGVD